MEFFPLLFFSSWIIVNIIISLSLSLTFRVHGIWSYVTPEKSRLTF
jgi:hypothetical protein